METRSVECLRCGNRRHVHSRDRRADVGECTRCGYLGWAWSGELTEKTRRTIRERPLELRRVRAVF
jgi:hypothetical protein